MVIKGNTTSTQFGVGIDAAVDQSEIFHNTFGGGLAIGGDRNHIASNHITVSYAIEAELGGNDNLVEYNNIDASSGVGLPALELLDGNGNVLRYNSLFGGAGGNDGIVVRPTPTNTRVVGNTVDTFADDGIQVNAPDTFIGWNTATNNGNLGIEAVPGVTDGGGNHASGNGNSLQCVNVRCSP